MTSLGKFPDPFLEEITGQPEAVRRAAAAVRAHVGPLGSIPRAPSRTIVFTGMGGSFHTCYPSVAELASRGIPALHLAASELLHFRQPILAEDSKLVAVSQSGQSAEVVALVEAVRRAERRPFIASVTNGLGNPLAERSDAAFDTRAGEELGPSTKTFVASLVTLSAVARVLGGEDPGAAAERTEEAAKDAARGMERLLADPVGQAEHLARWHRRRPTSILLGRGPGRAAAEMGALLVKEAAGIPAEALETGQFRHGPLELSGPDLAAIVFATEPETHDLDLTLASDLVDSGSAVLAVTQDGESPSGALGVAAGRLERSLLPAASIIPVQLLAWALAFERGRTPATLTRATKVTTHE